MDPSLNFNNFLKDFQNSVLRLLIFIGYVCFNTPNFGYTRKIKDSVSERNGITYPENLKKIEYNQYGIRNFLKNN